MHRLRHPTPTDMPANTPDIGEAARLAALHGLRVLDTLPEQAFDDIVQLASQICGTPVALVSLVDEQRQWFKARIGLAATRTHRDMAFCAHAIKTPDALMVVADTACDPRFRDNPLVTGDPKIRFYAGAPIVTPGGQALGTVCVLDTVPRELDAAQLGALQALARQASALFELRRRTMALEAQAQEVARLSEAAADERRHGAELLDLVLRGGSLGMWDLDVPTGQFTANDREFEMLGHDPADATAQAINWRTLIHPDDRASLQAALDRHLAGETPSYVSEHRVRHRDGHWIWVLNHAVVVSRDMLGVPLRIVGTHMDVSARINNRHALESARSLLLRMGTLAKVGGWELELATGHLSWTDEVYRIHEVDRSAEPALLSAIDFYAPEAQPLIQAAVAAGVAHGTPWDLELPFITAKGQARVVRAQGEAVFEHGKVVRLFGAFQDVTERKAVEQAALDSQRRLRLITDNLPALVAYVDREQRYRFLNAYVERKFGVSVEATLGRTIRETRSALTYALLEPHVNAALRGEAATFSYTETADGGDTHYQSNYVPDIDATGQVNGFLAMTFDVSELHRTQRQLERLARVDTLTGLPNRRQFDEGIDAALRRSRRSRQPLALMFLDIDHFKTINDTHGHAGGDAVLCEFGRRLKACVRTTDMVARLAGDEFVVLLENLAGAGELEHLAEKVVASIRPLFHMGSAELAVTTSIGVAITADAATSASSLLLSADEALYRAKKQGRNRFAIA
jgi:diguanylate cyclase